MWLRRQDSNLGMAAPKAAALPLGYASILAHSLFFNLRVIPSLLRQSQTSTTQNERHDSGSKEKEDKFNEENQRLCLKKKI